MELESVRQLKATLRDFPPAVTRVPAVTPALGIAPVGGGQYRLAVRLQDPALVGSERVARIAEAARGEVDVRYVGRVSKQQSPWPRTRLRPVAIGCSVGHFAVTAGTAGAFVTDSGDAPMLLSNNHVLANENRARAGDPILQPGTADGGHTPDDVVGALERFVPLEPGGVNEVDCALARMHDDVGGEPKALRGLGELGSVVDTAEAAEVAKIGRTTGLTFGIVSATDLGGLMVEYDAGTLRFEGQMEITSVSSEPFSLGGDSGSLIVTHDDHDAVGLLFAGSEPSSGGDTMTYAHPIGVVLAQLDTGLA